MKGEKKSGGTVAQYDVSDRSAMKASVKALHVLLCQEDDAWTAQGVEIDYAASGADLDEAIKNFTEGLALTVAQHLVIYGNMDKILSIAPKEVLLEWLKMPPAQISEVSFVATVEAFKEANVPKAEEQAKKFPFDGLQFVRPKKEEQLLA